MKRSVALFFCIAAFAAGSAGAGDLDRAVKRGPAGLKDTTGIDDSYPRLKLPRTVTSGLTLEFLQPDESAGTMVYGGTRNSPGLGLSSPEVVGGMLYSLSPKWSSSIETSVDANSPAGRGYAFLGQVHRSLPGGWDMSLGLRYRVAEGAAPPQYGGASEGAALPERAWSLYPPLAGTSASTGYELRLNYRYGERNTLGLTYGAGSEWDRTRQLVGAQPGEGRQLGLTGEHWLTPDWALNYGLMAQDQVGPRRGQGLRLGLRYRF